MADKHDALALPGSTAQVLEEPHQLLEIQGRREVGTMKYDAGVEHVEQRSSPIPDQQALGRSWQQSQRQLCLVPLYGSVRSDCMLEGVVRRAAGVHMQDHCICACISRIGSLALDVANNTLDVAPHAVRFTRSHPSSLGSSGCHSKISLQQQTHRQKDLPVHQTISISPDRAKVISFRSKQTWHE